MPDFQRIAFDWIVCRPAITGVAVIAAGLLCSLAGTRFIRFFLAIFAVTVGGAFGSIVAVAFNVSDAGMIAALGLVGGFVALLWPSVTLTGLAGLGWGGVASYALFQLGLKHDASAVGFVLGCMMGMVLTSVSRTAVTMLLTSVIGSGLMVIGCVGVAHDIFPTLASTFRELAQAQPMTVPVLVAMISVTTYTQQANSYHGDLVTGGYPESAL